MKVLKFGGTSVGTTESLSQVKKIVEAIEGPAVIVVSALGGLTDKLISTARKAAGADSSFGEDMQQIRKRHHAIISDLIENSRQQTLLNEVDPLLDELERIYEGIALIRDLPERTLDVIVSFGERISSHIVASLIKGGERHDSLKFIKTEKRYGKNVADTGTTTQLIKKEFKDGFNKAIVPGFISTDVETGEITNLGRGGSDFTGALVAAALDAEILEIWTDVDGFMTSDPRLIKDARVIETLSFTESMELCTFGAKVIYPPTIYPVFHKNIPIRILNTFNPTAPGTLVADNENHNIPEIKGVSALKNMASIVLQAGKDNDISGLSKRALNVLVKQGIKIYPVANPDPAVEYVFAIQDGDLESSLNVLSSEFAPELNDSKLLPISVRPNLSAIAIVGNGMRHNTRLSARIGHTLRREGINVEAFSLGNSPTTLTIFVDVEKTSRALELIHGLVFK